MILNYNDVVLRPQRSIVPSRSLCDTSASLGNNIFAVPVVAANMKSIITPEICKIFDKNNWFYVYHRIDGVQDVINFVKYANENLNITSISVGIKEEWSALVQHLASQNYKVDYFTVDVAHSYTDYVLPVLRAIKDFYPDAYVICGNGCTKEWVSWLESFKLVDCIKVGIGVSQSCLTRQFTGYGSSTLGSLVECVKASDGDIMSDGGITIRSDGVVCVGDVAKALVFGADWVMSGALFSKCIDSPALIHGYFGNASQVAKGDVHVEGHTVKVVSNGLTIEEQMQLIKESLRSSISYSGGSSVHDLHGKPYEIVGDFKSS